MVKIGKGNFGFLKTGNAIQGGLGMDEQAVGNLPTATGW